MIAGATKVLDGRVSQVKAAAGRREVAIAFEGDATFLDAPSLVERVSDHGQYVEVRLAEGADPQKLLALAVRTGVRVSRFELVEPSLRQIFIEKAEEEGLAARNHEEGFAQDGQGPHPEIPIGKAGGRAGRARGRRGRRR